MAELSTLKTLVHLLIFLLWHDSPHLSLVLLIEVS
jgi:hypothetical protein